MCCYDESKYAECHYAGCHYAGCHYAECHYARQKAECYCAEFHCDECFHDECHQAECRGAILTACAVQPMSLQDIFYGKGTFIFKLRPIQTPFALHCKNINRKKVFIYFKLLSIIRNMFKFLNHILMNFVNLYFSK